MGGKAVALALVLLLGTAGQAALSAGPSAGPDPVVEEWPEWPFPTSCGGVPFDPIEVFGGPTGAERGSRPSEVALRRFLQTEDWVRQLGAPLHHWRLLAETDVSAEFASGRLTRPGGPATMSFELEDGSWKLVGFSSGCRLASVIRGQPALSWTLAHDQAPLGPATRRIRIDLGPGPCSSGRSQNKRARKPIFWQVGKKWLMAIVLKPLPPGVYTCEGILEPPLEVTLPSRLGDRRLYDGSTYPPTDVVKAWRKRAARERAARR